MQNVDEGSAKRASQMHSKSIYVHQLEQSKKIKNRTTNFDFL